MMGENKIVRKRTVIKKKNLREQTWNKKRGK